MAFYRGLWYGKLKKALVLEMPLSKDQLSARVKQYVESEELKTKEMSGRIDTIVGGRAGGGDSQNSSKIYARREVYSIADSKVLSGELISFSEKDLEGVELPHDDPVVIAPIIANFTIERMLVDSGAQRMSSTSAPLIS
ncbi:hypothetical protein LIER_27521 [Lithospermum erythrorhizon]|uniref:Uncharacterized protein n=1 Tax=Lithospermum erythrorhizon TaxID=34254 RepID=A0AAV3RFZ1_LITER